MNFENPIPKTKMFFNISKDFSPKNKFFEKFCSFEFSTIKKNVFCAKVTIPCHNNHNAIGFATYFLSICFEGKRLGHIF